MQVCAGEKGNKSQQCVNERESFNTWGQPSKARESAQDMWKKSAGRVEWVERVDMVGVTEEDVRGRVRRMKMNS